MPIVSIPNQNYLSSILVGSGLNGIFQNQIPLSITNPSLAGINSISTNNSLSTNPSLLAAAIAASNPVSSSNYNPAAAAAFYIANTDPNTAALLAAAAGFGNSTNPASNYLNMGNNALSAVNSAGTLPTFGLPSQTVGFNNSLAAMAMFPHAGHILTTANPLVCFNFNHYLYNN